VGSEVSCRPRSCLATARVWNHVAFRQDCALRHHQQQEQQQIGSDAAVGTPFIVFTIATAIKPLLMLVCAGRAATCAANSDPW
jgi:hypothetical protein